MNGDATRAAAFFGWSCALALLALLALGACSDSEPSGEGGQSAEGGSGGTAMTGACGAPGQACEQSCTDMGSDGDCQGCAMMFCGPEVDACVADMGNGCLGCAQLLLESGDVTQSCGFNGDTCEPDTSCARFQAVGVCLCGEI